MSCLNNLLLYVIGLFLFHEISNQNVPNRDQVDTTMEYYPEDSYDQKSKFTIIFNININSNDKYF